MHLPVNLTASLRLLPQPHKKSYGRLQYCACISLVEQYPFDGLIHILQRFASFIRDVSHNHSLPMLQKVEQLNCSYFNQHLRSDLSPLNSFVLYTLFPPPSFHSFLLPMNALYDHLLLTLSGKVITGPSMLRYPKRTFRYRFT